MEPNSFGGAQKLEARHRTDSNTPDDQYKARAMKRWNESADQFNQWPELSTDEKMALIQAEKAIQPVRTLIQAPTAY